MPWRACSGPSARNADLFFSKHIEGSSKNKALEFQNGSGDSIDLATGGYSVQMFLNGSSTTGRTINLTGTTTNGDGGCAPESPDGF